MTKRVKDLTVEELAKICKEHICHTCPLKINLVGSKISDIFICAGSIANRMNDMITTYDINDEVVEK